MTLLGVQGQAFGQQIQATALSPAVCPHPGTYSENLCASANTSWCIKNSTGSQKHGKSHQTCRSFINTVFFPAFTNAVLIPFPCLLTVGGFCPSGLMKHRKPRLYLLISLSRVPVTVVSEATQAVTPLHSSGGRERSQGFIAAPWELTHHQLNWC